MRPDELHWDEDLLWHVYGTPPETDHAEVLASGVP